MTLFNYVSALLQFFLSQQTNFGGETRGAGTRQSVATQGDIPRQTAPTPRAPTTPASTAPTVAPTVAPTEAATQAAAAGASSAAPQSQAIEQAKAAQGSDKTQLGLILKAILTSAGTGATDPSSPQIADTTAGALANGSQLDERTARTMAEAQLRQTRDAVILQRISDVATAYAGPPPAQGAIGATGDGALPGLLTRFEAATGYSGYASLVRALAAAAAPETRSSLSLRL